MNKTYIDVLLREKRIRQKTVDISKIRSLLESIETNANVTLDIKLTKDSATVIFRELYESIRELGDALWWIEGYEPQDHGISIELLEIQPVKNPTTLKHLERYKTVRHDIQYRGFRASETQTKELTEFWNTSGKEILKQLKTKTSNTIV